jgi:hypothetical protein
VSGSLPPSPTVQVNGSGVLNDSYLNSLVQGGMLLGNLQGFTALNGMTALMIGSSAPGIGASGLYWFNSSSTATPDNINVIQPNGLLTGRWLLLPPPSTVDVYNVKGYGATGNGTTDDTAAINAAIAAATTAGSGVIYFPPGNYKYTSTIAPTIDNLSFTGAGTNITTITFANGSADCFSFVGTSYASMFQGINVNNLSIVGTGKTGGRAIFFQYCAYCYVEKVFLLNSWNGLQDQSCNTITVRDVLFQGVTSGVGGWGIYFNAPGDGSANGIELNLTNVTVNCLWSGADGIRWDGGAETLNTYNTTMLDVRYGLYVLNSASSTTVYPQYGEFVTFTVDGASAIACNILAGANYKFTGCNLQNTSGESGQGSNDTNAIFIGADTGFSYTREVQFVNCFIGLSKLGAVSTAAHNVLFNTCRFGSGSTAVANSVDAVTVAAPANDTMIDDCIFSYYGAPNNWRYGINIASGTFRTTSQGCNFNIGCQTAAYLNNSGDINSFVNNFLGPPSSEPGSITQWPSYATAPANPGAGQVYYDSTLVTARYWNGSAWVNFP